MRKFIPLAAVLLAGCPHVNPPPRSVAVSVSATLPSASENCVTVRRNPRTNEVETTSCIDTVVVSAPKKIFEAVAEKMSTADAIAPSRSLVESVAESESTVDSLWCPFQAKVAVVETETTNDALTCGGN